MRMRRKMAHYAPTIVGMLKTTDLPILKQRMRTLIRDELCLAQFSEDDSGDFLFRYERMRLAMVFDADDPAFLWIAHFGFHWVKGSDLAAVARVDRCISAVNYRVKGVKLGRASEPDRDGDFPITASVSFLVEDVALQGAEALERYLAMIKAGCGHFHELMSAEISSEDEGPRTCGLRTH